MQSRYFQQTNEYQLKRLFKDTQFKNIFYLIHQERSIIFGISRVGLVSLWYDYCSYLVVVWKKETSLHFRCWEVTPVFKFHHDCLMVFHWLLSFPLNCKWSEGTRNVCVEKTNTWRNRWESEWLWQKSLFSVEIVISWRKWSWLLILFIKDLSTPCWKGIIFYFLSYQTN